MIVPAIRAPRQRAVASSDGIRGESGRHARLMKRTQDALAQRRANAAT